MAGRKPIVPESIKQSGLLREQVRTKSVSLELPPAHPKQLELINAFDARRDSSGAVLYDPSVSGFESLPLAFPDLRFVVGAMGTKQGKALSLLELVPTPSGWRTMGDIKEGDYVFDENGKPTLVTYVTDPMYGHVVYDVVFSDGSVVRADAEHVWVTETHVCRKANGELNGVTKVKYRRKSTNQKPQKRTTEEILQTLQVKIGGRLRPNHSIALVSAPLQYPEQNLPIDPYVLGAWLGDGHTSSGAITGIDTEVFDNVKAAGYDVRLIPSQKIVWRVDGLTVQLRELGVYGNKHVPQQYLVGSVEQRLALLQGLMDTDGTIGERGECSFYNTNKTLADAVAELACSLGIKVTRGSKLPKINGSRHGKNGEYSKCYIINFTTDLPVFRLKRKLNRIRPVAAKAKRRYIVDVRPVPSVPVKCIRVASLRHLFLIGKACIPTHNTFGCSIKIVQEAWRNWDYEANAALDHPGLYWWVAPSYSQSKNAYNLVKRLLPKGFFEEYKADLRLVLKNPDGSEHSNIEFKSADNYNTLRGFEVSFFIFDEAARGVDYQAFISVMTTVTKTRGRGVIISTPNGRNWFYDVYQRGDKGTLLTGEVDDFPEWLSIRMPTWTNPHVPLKSVQEMRRNLPEDVFRQEVAAEFMSDGAGVFRGVDKCIKGILDAKGYPIFELPQLGKRYIMGVDLARKRDYTVLTVADQSRNHIVHWERFNQLSWEIQKHRIVALSKQFNNATIWMDSTGLGDPIVDSVRNSGCHVEAFIISSKSKQQLIDKLRVNIEFQKVSYPQITTLVKELKNYEYEISTSGVVKYSAPSGTHDDAVISLALANWGADILPWKYSYLQKRGV